MTFAATDSAMFLPLVVNVVSIIVSVAVGAIAGMIAWQNRRIVTRNDEEHSELRTDIKGLAAGQAAMFKEIGEVAGDRPRRQEIIGQYAAIQQRLGDVGERVAELKGAFDQAMSERRQP